MHAKHIIILVCSTVLLAAMAAALAAENASADGHNKGSYESATSAQAMQKQSGSNSDGGSQAMTNQAQMSPETATDQNTTAGTNDASTKSAQGQTVSAGGMNDDGADATNGKQSGRLVGTLVDESGHVLGYVIRSRQAGANGANWYVVVPRENARRPTGASSGKASAARFRNTGQAIGRAGTMQRERLLQRMYRQLLKQAMQIRLLRQQLAELQFGMNNRMGRGDGQPADVRQAPLDQVKHVIVDRSGRVQAIVLDSGVILASDEQGQRDAGSVR